MGPTGRFPSGHLVGRDAQLRRLEEAFRAVRAGDRRSVCVLGEPGAGKTSLVRAAASRWSAAGGPDGTVVAVGAGRQDGGSLAWAPVTEAWRAVEAAGAPSLTDLFTRLGGLGPLPADVSRTWLLDQLDRALCAVAERQPVVLVLEDLHWADDATWDLTRYLAGATTGRVLLVVTCRPVPAGTAAPPGERVHLGPLDDASVAVLARRRLIRYGTDDATDGDAGDGTDDQVHDVVLRAHGNPYLAEQLAGALARGDAVLPESLRQSLSERLHHAGTGVPEAVAVVAVAGEEPRPRVLPAVAALVGSRVRADVALTAAERAGLVVTGLRPGTLRVEHPLLGEVATAALSAHERATAHRSLAGALPDPAARARHHEAAGDRGEALGCWLVAARAASATGDVRAAAAAWRRVTALVQQLGVPAGEPPDGLAVEAAEALHRAGDDDGAVHLLRDRLAGPSTAGAATRLALLDRLQACLFAAGDAPAAFAVLDEAAALVPAATGTPEAARVVAADGSRWMVLGRYPLGASRSAHAAALAGEAGDDEVRAYALTTEGVCTAAAGDASAGLARLALAESVAATSGGVAVQARVAVNRCYVLANTTDHEGCVLTGREALSRLANRSLDGTLGAPLHVNVAASLLALGRWDEALRACAAAEAVGVPTAARAFLALTRARVHALRGQVELAVTALEDGERERPPGQPAFDAELTLARAVVLQAAGRPHEVVTLALDEAAGTEGVDRLRLCAEGLRALADLDLGRGRARRLVDAGTARTALLAELERRDGGWGGHSPEARLLRSQCAAESRRTGTADAADWQPVLAGWSTLGMRHDEAYAGVRVAEAMVTSGNLDGALPYLRRAHGTAAALGAQPLLHAVRTLARRARLPLARVDDRAGAPAVAAAAPDEAVPAPGSSPPSNVATEALATLTRREREVLGLLAAGRTNRQIARRLVISEKTAEAHVSHVLAKLGAGNRVEAARAAHLLPGRADR